jgi:hypothetical protein
MPFIWIVSQNSSIYVELYQDKKIRQGQMSGVGDNVWSARSKRAAPATPHGHDLSEDRRRDFLHCSSASANA